MALSNGLALWCYTLPPAPTALRAYETQLEDLTFSSVAPAGYAAFSAKLRVPDARLPRPELQPFARVAIMDPTAPSIGAQPSAR